LGDDHFHSRGDEERLNLHVDEPGQGSGGVVGVQGAEHQVTGQSGADGDVGGFAVADFPDHDDIGILAQNVAQGAGEGEADLAVDLGLVDALDLVFDRILDRDDAAAGGIDLADKGGEGGGFPGTGGPVTRMMP
jgi:hypothetical protein